MDDTESVSVDAEEFVENIALARKFLNGSIQSGEILLQLSGLHDTCQAVSVEPCLKAFELILTELSGGRQCEIAVGIIANLLLHSETFQIIVTSFDVARSLLACCSSSDDPMIYSECFRAFANILYNKESGVLHPYVENLTTLCLFTVHNSIDSKLLMQTFQLIYYILEYANSDFINEFFKHWKADDFFLTVLEDAQMLTVLSESSDKLCNYSGMEWLFLTLEKVLGDTVGSPAVSNVWLTSVSEKSFVNTLSILLITLLTGPNTISNISTTTEATTSTQQSVNFQVAITLSTGEKFLVVFILVLFTEQKSATSGDDTETFLRINLLFHENPQWYAALLTSLIELWEEAVLIREVSTIEPTADLINYLLTKQRMLIVSADDNDSSSHNANASNNDSTKDSELTSSCIKQLVNKHQLSCLMRGNTQLMVSLSRFLSLLTNASTVKWIHAEVQHSGASSGGGVENVFFYTNACLSSVLSILSTTVDSVGNQQQQQDEKAQVPESIVDVLSDVRRKLNDALGHLSGHCS